MGYLLIALLAALAGSNTLPGERELVPSVGQEAAGRRVPVKYVLPVGTPTVCSLKKKKRGPWVTDADYPKEALSRRLAGTTHFTLDVSEAGCPTTCTITRSSGHALLDERTCTLMLMRADFKPPVDEQGRPKAVSWQSKFNWVAP